MKTVRVYQYSAFSTVQGKGNPAGVVFDADDLTDDQMLDVAKQAGYNETAFIVRSNVADLRIRYFTPGHEMNLCGHGTVACLYALQTKELLKREGGSLQIETKAGILPITIDTSVAHSPMITMQQAPAQFVPFTGSLDELTASIGLTREDLDPRFPVVYGSTGIWTLIVPIRGLDACVRMVPNNQQFPEVLKEMPRASVHPFCLETYDASADLHGRHFSSPYSGTIEDPVTGTASGVMGAYYAAYIREPSDDVLRLVVEQGHEIEREGQVRVEVTSAGDTWHVQIAGTGVFVNEFDVQTAK